MLQLKNITKVYELGKKNDKNYQRIDSLKGVDIEFRKCEFVSILGPSGCGKTTLLNIIGGLDKYTSGDLIINGKSTKQYKDADWDNYRNHSVGFVFQSYNLIPHQTVLQNVELALTLSGIGKAERKQRATEVLKKVGLGDRLNMRPNQLSGGQMQRVAIARALVNDPEIILADEPTGALDSKTSVQIMDILKEISADKLIIMVTHNPELAEKYSTRLVKLLDGNITSDTMPYDSKKEQVLNEDKNQTEIATTIKDGEVAEAKENVSLNQENGKNETTESASNTQGNVTFAEKPKFQKTKKTHMSFWTAVSLSFKNLLTKKARTFLVAFAGSIGIIGICLVLAISSGFSGYVNQVQKDTLSSYPVELTNSSYDMASLMQIFISTNDGETETDKTKVYTKQELTEMLKKFNASSSSSDLKSFKEYIEGDGKEELDKYVSAVQIDYGQDINAYYNGENGIISANPSTVFSDVISAYGVKYYASMTDSEKIRYGLLKYMFGEDTGYYKNEFWSEMIDNQKLLSEQYELIGEGSHWATKANEIMIVVDKNNQISDYTLYGLGLLNQDDLNTLLKNYIEGEDSTLSGKTFTYEELLGLKYKLVLQADYYELQSDGTYIDIREYGNSSSGLYNLDTYNQKIQELYNNGIEIEVAGIIREKENASSTSITTTIAYTKALTEKVISENNAKTVIQDQLNNPFVNVLTNQNFENIKDAQGNVTKTIAQQYQEMLNSLGYVDDQSPEAIYLYPINFESKTDITNYISKYNQMKIDSGHEDQVVTYSDTMGTMMSSISVIISAITYVLIAFVSVSLVVSSIMIGIITYISVIERTKEIGVLRSVGASKRDIKRVFTAESLIIGLFAGLLGVAISFIFVPIINAIITPLTGISNLASLPLLGAGILVIVSMLLTFIAGLFPAKVASKKDPVIALRTE